MKIALVEPDPVLADLVSFRLELLGHEVVTWQAARDMLAALGESTMDLMILDTDQADINGWEAIQKVRQVYSSEEMPILALSVDTDLSLVEQAFKAGANDYLITPFDPAILQEKTDAMLLRRRKAMYAK